MYLNRCFQLASRIAMEDNFLVGEVARFRALFGNFQARVRRLICFLDGLSITRFRVTTTMHVCVSVSEANRAGNM